MKNEVGNSEIIEAVSIKSKVYSYVTKKDKQKEEDKLNGKKEEEVKDKKEILHKKLKGIKSCVVENDISH